ncbi:Redoxin [Basidiobolus meristosporus CBS 931.73]|uniref:Thioredoxin-dependent peroxiredoxin n=1 Tax=Basidiobolus meristosporus CBS 931.73 TaxID=1314790 RepID=A0A1Y1XP78_9FUNG|nr:Redoxin [Basidiobolus meristosporus CBS 931.73]|eukprot:ORX87541.1 Redoxin [Basidiobolus meristosporus CBS 931.73]
MSVQVGTVIPDITLKYCEYDASIPADACGKPQDFHVHEKLKGKKAVIFAVPGAFTPTCHNDHLPGYLKKYNELKSKKVDLVICLAANDAFVMDAWGKAQKVQDKILMVSDGNLEFTKKLGLTMDARGFAMGERTQRFAMVVDDLKVSWIGVENGPGLEVSSVDSVLSNL